MQEQQPYGAYAGNPQYDGPPQQQSYSIPSQGQGTPPPIYDDASMDALAQHLSQRMAQGTQGKIYPQRKDRASAGQRLALAIVSIAMLVPILGVITGLASDTSWFVGAAAFGVAALVIIIVNVVFNMNG